MTTSPHPKKTDSDKPHEAVAGKQAKILTRYLIGKTPDQTTIQLYSAALRRGNHATNPIDAKLLRLAFNHPWCIGLLDGGLALSNPHSELRRRIYIVFSLLEASPHYHKHFMPQQHSPLYIFVIGYKAALAGLRGLFGLLLVKAVTLGASR